MCGCAIRRALGGLPPVGFQVESSRHPSPSREPRSLRPMRRRGHSATTNYDGPCARVSAHTKSCSAQAGAACGPGQLAGSRCQWWVPAGDRVPAGPWRLLAPGRPASRWHRPGQLIRPRRWLCCMPEVMTLCAWRAGWLAGLQEWLPSRGGPAVVTACADDSHRGNPPGVHPARSYYSLALVRGSVTG